MSEPSSPPPAGQSVQHDLHELARRLREARHLKAEDQRTLSDLLDELAEALGPAAGTSAEKDRLAQAAAQLAESLHRPPAPGLVAAAKERLEEAAVHAETDAPVATGIIWRLVEALSNLGI
jgi:hypothetical protein